MLRQRQSLKAERHQKRQAKQEKKTTKSLIKQSQQTQALEQLSAKASKRYVPSLGLIFRIHSIIRIIGALSAPVQDCDEVYNYWEQLHFLQFGEGKQTWEYAPQFALRSYGFLKIFALFTWLLHLVFGFRSKVQVFYALRVLMGLASAGCEAVVVRRVAEKVDSRVALWMMAGIFGMAGMWHQAVALLPSSFAMCLCMLGTASAMQAPSEEGSVRNRALGIGAFAVAAACGWPYAAVVAVPMIVEEIVWSCRTWRFDRLPSLAAVGAASVVASLAAMAAVDSFYYGRPVVAAWNQIKYNVLGGIEGADSTLYGTEPWHFYIKNGLLNGNLLMVLALASLPLWTVYFFVLHLSARSTGSSGDSAGPQILEAARRLRESHMLLLYRVLPFNLTLLVFSLQPHKEERFLSIVYPHMCFNAAVALSLLHPLSLWLSSFLRSGRIGRHRINVGCWVGWMGWATVGVAALLGFLRMAALSQYHGAPIRAFMALQQTVLDNSSYQHTNDLPLLPLGPTVKTLMGAKTGELLPLTGIEKQKQFTVCMDHAWHYFPSSYWLPPGFRLQFVEWQGFDGLLPGDFVPVSQSGSVRASTSAERPDFNALNRWEPSHAVNSTQMCDFYVGVFDSENPSASLQDYEGDGIQWETVACVPMLDLHNSRLAARVLYVPSRIARLLDALLTGNSSGTRWLRWNSMCVSRRKVNNTSLAGGATYRA
ncbi:mannosyltransferase [Coemansia asiatica]|uniref:Mannosyltransferase n=1 Tax=Coemansia asiatica TaxID=1052880 RepID=A0A9W7XKW5_9FUNG|nr:mannosyltransferase [Coemansia asiatica]